MIGHLKSSSDHIGKFSFDSIYLMTVFCYPLLYIPNIVDDVFELVQGFFNFICRGWMLVFFLILL